MDEDKNKINLENIAESLDKEVTQDKKISQSEDAEMTQEEIKDNETPSTPPVSQDTQIKPVLDTPGPLEDIFSETDQVKPAVLQPKESSMSEEEKEESSVFPRKLITLVVVILILVAMVIGVYFGYNYYIKGLGGDANNVIDNQVVPIKDILNQEAENNEANVNETLPNNIEDNTGQVSNAEPINFNLDRNQTEEIDTDGDGLSDQDEIVRGMNIESNDSDSDGLYDREEVMVYNTDPINPDTDGDGFSDGDEVKAGYNPKGAGKLYDLTGVK